MHQTVYLAVQVHQVHLVDQGVNRGVPRGAVGVQLMQNTLARFVAVDKTGTRNGALACCTKCTAAHMGTSFPLNTVVWNKNR